MWGFVALLGAWAIGWAAGYLHGRGAVIDRDPALPRATTRRRDRKLDISLALARPAPRFTGLPAPAENFEESTR